MARSTMTTMGIVMGESERRERRRYFIVLLCSLFIVMGGMIWTLHIGKQSNHYAHVLFHEEYGLQSLRSYLKTQEARGQ